MDWAAFGITFGLVFLAELPDKTAIATLVLSSRFKGLWVFCGVAAAFVIQVTIAVVAGTFIAKLPQRPVEFVVAIFFLIGAVLLWRESLKDDEQEELDEESELEAIEDTDIKKGFFKVFGIAFSIVFVAEFLDLTQILTANLAIRFDSPLSVGLGAFLALCSVAALAILGGKALLRVLPLRTITRIASVLLFVLAAFSLFEAIRG